MLLKRFFSMTVDFDNAAAKSKWMLDLKTSLSEIIDTVNGISTSVTTSSLAALPVYANNAAALAGGLKVGQLYRNGDMVQVVH